jgi:hypothetical protein
MQLTERSRQRDAPFFLGKRRHKSVDKVERQQRCIRRNRYDPSRIGRMCQRPSHPRQHAGQRTDGPCHRVRNHGQREGREPLRITIRVDDGSTNLGPQPVDHMAEHCLAVEFQKTLVAAPHATRQSAG